MAKTSFMKIVERVMMRLLGIKRMPITLREGDPAPDFTLTEGNGQPFTLLQFKGDKPVVLFFYPRDDTPGCTKEACGFRDDYAALQETGVQIFGISTDSQASHKAFAAKFNLPFPLLADTDGTVSKAYGLYIANRHMAQRSSFLIAQDGTLKKIYPDVDPVGHSREILTALK